MYNFCSIFNVFIILVLDPRLKLTYHKENNWEEEFITEAKNSIKDLYEKLYAETTDPIQEDELTVDDDLISHMYKKRRFSGSESELEIFLNSPIVHGETDILNWWKVCKKKI